MKHHILKTCSYPVLVTALGVFVHFADGTTQQWLLVRLDKPGEAADAPTR